MRSFQYFQNEAVSTDLSAVGSETAIINDSQELPKRNGTFVVRTEGITEFYTDASLD